MSTRKGTAGLLMALLLLSLISPLAVGGGWAGLICWEMGLGVVAVFALIRMARK